MAKRLLAGGIEVEYPDGLRLREGDDGGGGLGAAPGEASALAADPVIEAAQSSGEFTLVEPFELHGMAAGESLGALADDAAGGEVVVVVPLAENESAVQLTETDGVLRWEYPVAIEEAELGGLGAASARGRVAVFRSPYRPVVAQAPEVQPLGFSPVDLLLAPVKKVVLRFVARKTAEKVSVFLERKVKEGPILYTRKPDGRIEWGPVADFGQAWAGGAAPRRLLLFVHGTFSDVDGSFGGLATNPQGRAFLAQALGSYDAVAGFDHKTLAKTVGENAADLLAALDGLPASGEVAVDAIAFSRGGLVLRYLTEVLLPTRKSRFRLEKAIFVGCTNGGTQLADPKNWKDLLDLYTNLVSAAGRLAGRLGGPQTQIASRIVSGALTGAFSFVAYLAEATTAGKAVPGLASMHPGGADVTLINSRQEGQPQPGKVGYYVIDANFDHTLFGDGKLEDVGLPKRFFLEFADHFIEQLFADAQNDLVVDRASMSRIDPWTAEKWIVERHGFEADAGVYHTVYFHDPKLATRLAAWLRRDGAEA